MSNNVTFATGIGATLPAATVVETEDQGAGVQRQVVKTGGAGTIATNQISVASTATVIAAARTARLDLTIINSGATAVYLGGSGVTTSNGLLLPGILGASITLSTTAAVYGIVGSGTQAVSYLETY